MQATHWNSIQRNELEPHIAIGNYLKYNTNVLPTIEINTSNNY
jgi:hypothetical protein